YSPIETDVVVDSEPWKQPARQSYLQTMGIAICCFLCDVSRLRSSLSIRQFYCAVRSALSLRSVATQPNPGVVFWFRNFGKLLRCVDNVLRRQTLDSGASLPKKDGMSGVACIRLGMSLKSAASLFALPHCRFLVQNEPLA